MSEPTAPPFSRVMWTMMRSQPWRYAAALFLWTSIWTMPLLVGFLIAYFFDQLEAGIETTTVVLIVAADVCLRGWALSDDLPRNAEPRILAVSRRGHDAQEPPASHLRTARRCNAGRNAW